MRLVLTGRHVDITPGLRRLVDGKLARLGRLLGDSIISAQITLTREKDRHVADVTLRYNFPAAGLTDEALQTLIVMVLSAGVDARSALVGGADT